MKVDPVDVVSEAFFGTFISPFVRGGTYYLAMVLGAWLAEIGISVEATAHGYCKGIPPLFDDDMFLFPLQILLSSAGIPMVSGLLVIMFIERHFFHLLALTVLGSSAIFLYAAKCEGIAWIAGGALNLGIAAVLVFASILHRNRNARAIHDIISETYLLSLNRMHKTERNRPSSNEPPDERAE